MRDTDKKKFPTLLLLVLGALFAVRLLTLMLKKGFFDYIDVEALVGKIGYYLDFIPAEALILLIIAILATVITVSLLTKKRYTMVPTMEYYPPDGLNPAELGYVIDGYISPEDLTSLIYYWASHGHLVINMADDGSFTLRRINELDDEHSDYERQLYSDMWYIGGKRTGSPKDRKDEDFRLPMKSRLVTSEQLAADFAAPLKKAYKSLRASFDKTDRRLFDKKRRRSAALVPAVMLTISLLMPFLQFVNAMGLSFLIGALLSSILGGIALATLLGGVLLVIITVPGIFIAILVNACMDYGFTVTFYPCLAALLFFLAYGLFDTGYLRRRVNKKASRAYTVAAWITGAAAVVVYILTFLGTNINIYFVAFFSVCLFACIAISPRMRNFTEYGAGVIARCEGFRNFLCTAEKSRLEMLLADDPDYYYNILPYAHVLGVSGIWAEKTADISAELPSWFSGEYGSSNIVTASMMNALHSLSDLFRKGAGKLRRSGK